MSARALFYSPILQSPPYISARNKLSRAELRPRGLPRLLLGVLSGDRVCSFRVSVRDVKSESYNVSEKSVKFEEALKDIALRSEDLGVDSESLVPWWEQFPKRWLIVVLCFSAFLLCNMDRVNF